MVLAEPKTEQARVEAARAIRRLKKGQHPQGEEMRLGALTETGKDGAKGKTSKLEEKRTRKSTTWKV